VAADVEVLGIAHGGVMRSFAGRQQGKKEQSGVARHRVAPKGKSKDSPLVDLTGRWQ
jgi:hypothetical protein